MIVGDVLVRVFKCYAQGRKDIADPMCYPVGRFRVVQIPGSVAGGIG